MRSSSVGCPTDSCTCSSICSASITSVVTWEGHGSARRSAAACSPTRGASRSNASDSTYSQPACALEPPWALGWLRIWVIPSREAIASMPPPHSTSSWSVAAPSEETKTRFSRCARTNAEPSALDVVEPVDPAVARRHSLGPAKDDPRVGVGGACGERRGDRLFAELAHGAKTNQEPSMRWRGLEPPRGFNPTRPSTLRVYQFRHQRAARIVAAPPRLDICRATIYRRDTYESNGRHSGGARDALARAAFGLRHQVGRRPLDAFLLGGELRADLPGSAAARAGRPDRGRGRPE